MQNPNMPRPMKKEKIAKARTRTIVRALAGAGPSIAGVSPDLNEDHMDEQMVDEKKANKTSDTYEFHNEYKEVYPDLDDHYKIL